MQLRGIVELLPPKSQNSVCSFSLILRGREDIESFTERLLDEVGLLCSLWLTICRYIKRISLYLSHQSSHCNNLMRELYSCAEVVFFFFPYLIFFPCLLQRQVFLFSKKKKIVYEMLKEVKTHFHSRMYDKCMQ